MTAERRAKCWATRGDYFNEMSAIGWWRSRGAKYGMNAALENARRIRHTDVFHEEMIPGEPPPDLPALPENWKRRIFHTELEWGSF